jgi:hypothetical protein
MNQLDYMKALGIEGMKFSPGAKRKTEDNCPLCGKEMKIYTRSCGRLGYKACICGHYERIVLTSK